MAALDVIELAITRPPAPPVKINNRKSQDTFGLGKPFSTWVANAYPAEDLPFAKTIITHARPDADAVVATWMAERFIFAGKRCRVRFVANRYRAETEAGPEDCVVDVGKVYDPEKLQFDHRPPFFQNRDETCAAKLVFEYLMRHNVEAGNLRELTETIHDGDSVSRRSRSERYAARRRDGFHAHFTLIKALSDSDMVLYRATAIWLDAIFRRNDSPDGGGKSRKGLKRRIEGNQITTIDLAVNANVGAVSTPIRGAG